MSSAVPLVSVVLPTYNRADLLAEALESLAAQTYRDFEVLVVNDCGEDVSSVIARAESIVPAIRLFVHDRNRGLPASRNTALAAARGELVAYLDDDDRFLPDHLAEIVPRAHETPAVWFSGFLRSELMLEEGRWSLCECVEAPFPVFDREKLFLENFAPVCCFVHPRSFSAELGGFDESLTALEDWDLWLRMSQRFPFRGFAKRTVDVRSFRSAESLSSLQNRGYAWAALNALYKYFPFAAQRPELTAHYRTKVSEAIDHLCGATLEAFAGKISFRVVYSRYSPSEARARAQVLEDCYDSDHGLFAELRGLLALCEGDLTGARTELLRAVRENPRREHLPQILSWLTEPG